MRTIRSSRKRFALKALWLTELAVVWLAVFAAAQLRTYVLAAPALDRRVGPLTVTGHVVEVEKLPTGHKKIVEVW